MNALETTALRSAPEPLLQFEELPDGSLRVVKTRAGTRYGVGGVWAALIVSSFLSVVFGRSEPWLLLFGWFIPLIAMGCVFELVWRYFGCEEWVVSPNRLQVHTRLGRWRWRKEFRSPCRLRINWVRSRSENGDLIVDEACLYVPRENWDLPRLRLLLEVPIDLANTTAEVLASRLGWCIERTEQEPVRGGGGGGP